MAVKKLSNDIQSLFSSSINLFNYKRAVEELVYNALDAESTSIAIRVNIQQRKIQIIDNGNGISKENFPLLGQRYATSKFVDISRFKSAPNSYGFRGQALASIVDVSKYVKITSRTSDEDTWTKTFYKGKEKEIDKATFRPSKGTTVEINEFLYNLKIQSKAVNHINELNDIKNLLEQLSLIHSNVSFSLRDDSRNEIVFQIHKNRDIYQTFKSLYDIDKSDIQELQVEKGEYKAIAFIAKDFNSQNRHQLIFLNKKVVHNTRLHKLIQEALKKTFYPNQTRKLKCKTIDYSNDCDTIRKYSNIPFFFMFITCPFYDYEISNTPKQSTLEFKNWNQIITLIEKVVKFYTGDLKIFEIKKNKSTVTDINKENEDTRTKVREIIRRILGSHPKGPGVSQMQNGIKGKFVKRIKKNNKKMFFSKAISPDINQVKSKELSYDVTRNEINDNMINVQPTTSEAHIKNSNVQRKCKTKTENYSKNFTKQKHSISKLTHINKSKKLKKKKIVKDKLVEAFENPTYSLIERCNQLEKEVQSKYKTLAQKKKRKQRVYVNETINYSNIIKNNENISIKNRVQETIIHDYIPLKPSNCCNTKETENEFKTTYDLLNTILDVKGTQNIYRIQNNRKLPQHTFESHHYKNVKDIYLTGNDEYSNIPAITPNLINEYIPSNHIDLTERLQRDCLNSPMFLDDTNITYNYYSRKTNHRSNSEQMRSRKAAWQCGNYLNDTIHLTDDNNILQDEIQIREDSMFNDDRRLEYISDINFHVNSDQRPPEIDSPRNRKHDDRTFQVINIDESSYPLSGNVTTNIGFTYTLSKFHTIPNSENYLRPTSDHSIEISDELRKKSTIQECKTKEVSSNLENEQQPLNVIFISNTQSSNIEEDMNHNIVPLNVCEAILNSNDDHENSIELNINANGLIDSFFEHSSSNIYEGQENTAQPAQKIVPTVCNGGVNSSHHLVDTNINMVDENIVNIQEPVNQTDKEQQEDNIKYPITDMDNFNMRNRLRFLPKGMSPIFRNSKSKIVPCDFSNTNDYFEDDMFNRFLDNIQTRAEIFKPILNPKDATTRAIDKVNHKLNQESSSLTFNSESLVNAKVLGQVDNKFIASIMKGNSESSEFLVLFDQHAVHERIRLEQNLADYFNGNEWKAVKLDDVILKLSKDEILYLHNYKDKFTQFGLHWTILNNRELKLHAIPEAILGKNSRQVDKVIYAVRNLISEQVDFIKTQKGCAYLFPKSIMDLVFSEACRYAIMFGDQLSKTECSELIRTLSTCKTPFQCAHGRPVMAVIMDMQLESRNYTVQLEKLRNFCHVKKTN